MISSGIGVTYTSSSSTVSISGTTVKGTNAGTYSITATPNSGYGFSDGTTSKTLSCSIAKAESASCVPTVSYGGGNIPNDEYLDDRGSGINGVYTAGTFTYTSSNITPLNYKCVFTGPADRNEVSDLCRSKVTQHVKHGDKVTGVFTPNDTTNYLITNCSTNIESYKYSTNSSSQTGPEIFEETASKVASIGTCNDLIYNSKEQELVSGGSNVTYENNLGIDAKSYKVIAKANSGYKFSDGTTTQELNCEIKKRDVDVNRSNTTLVYNNSNQSPTATISLVNGSKLNLKTTTSKEIGNHTSIASINDNNISKNYTINNIVEDYEITKQEFIEISGNHIENETLKVNTNKDINSYKWYYFDNQSDCLNNKNKKEIKDAIYNNFILDSNSKGKYIGVEADNKLISKCEVIRSKVTYKVNYYLMNKDKVNYTLVKSNTYDGVEGDIVTGKLLEFNDYKTPSQITINLENGKNIINYYYERV